jgi:hypothetical protein
MAKLTWLGTEDYREGETPLESCVWCGVLFTAFDKVEVLDQWMIAKARGNRYFRVEDGNGNPPPEPPPPEPRYPDTPPDYPPEDEPDREPNKKRRSGGARPPRIRNNGNGD